MARFVQILIIAASAIFTVGCASPSKHSEAPGVEFPHTILFDNQTQHLFWYGHELRSPVTFTFERDTLRANGISYRPVPSPDTINMEEKLGRIFKDIPFVQRLHREGLSYHTAVDSFGIVSMEEHKRIARGYLKGSRYGRNAALDSARAAATPGVVDTSKGILVDEHGMTLTFYGPLSTQHIPGIVDSMASYTPRPPGPDPRRVAAGTVSLIEWTLQRERATVILFGPAGMISGGQRIMDDITRGLAQMERTGRAPQDLMIPDHNLYAIYYAKHPEWLPSAPKHRAP